MVGQEKEIEQERSLWGRLFTGDRALWIIIALLLVISVLVVYSSTAKMVYAGSSDKGTYAYMFKQMLFVVVSLAGILFVHKWNYQVYSRWAWLFYFVAVALTIGAYIPGIGKSINGAHRWISMGFFDLQPSEMLKVATILLLAKILASRQTRAEKLELLPPLAFWRWGRNRKRVWRIIREETIPVLGPVVMACAVILPAHTSSAAMLFFICWIMMAIGRIRSRELFKLLFLALLAAVLGMAVLRVGRTDTAHGRMYDWVTTLFFDQSNRPIEDLTDTQRAMTAIYNGGLTGQGAGQSLMRVELIHPESDYAFAIIVEEYGLFFAIIVMMLYLWVFYRSKLIFERCGTAFPSLLVLGLGLMITFQALVHILVTINLFPETGQPLPLISHGGSSILFTSIALGMILGVSRQTSEQTLDRPRGESLYENKSR